MTLDPTSDSRPPSPGFAADVSAAARALVDQPTVALVPIVLWSLPALTGPHQSGSARVSPWFFAGAVALVLFLCGWAGAERIFFLRQFQGKPISLRHLLSLVNAFMGRFLALGAMLGVAFIPYCIVLTLVFRAGFGKVPPAPFRITTTLFVVLTDLALTFIPAALAFTTRSVSRAIRIGLAMIRETWPRSALYVFCPVLALNLNRLVYPVDLPALRLLAAAGLAVVALLAKGATVAFYLRQRPSHSEDGAAHLQDG
jgi:hypothetical protein